MFCMLNHTYGIPMLVLQDEVFFSCPCARDLLRHEARMIRVVGSGLGERWGGVIAGLCIYSSPPP